MMLIPGIEWRPNRNELRRNLKKFLRRPLVALGLIVEIINERKHEYLHIQWCLFLSSFCFLSRHCDLVELSKERNNSATKSFSQWIGSCFYRYNWCRLYPWCSEAYGCAN